MNGLKDCIRQQEYVIPENSYKILTESRNGSCIFWDTLSYLVLTNGKIDDKF